MISDVQFQREDDHEDAMRCNEYTVEDMRLTEAFLCLNNSHLTMDVPPSVPAAQLLSSDFGDVGYQFWKKFHVGWFEGKVVQIRPNASEFSYHFILCVLDLHLSYGTFNLEQCTTRTGVLFTLMVIPRISHCLIFEH